MKPNLNTVSKIAIGTGFITITILLFITYFTVTTAQEQFKESTKKIVAIKDGVIVKNPTEIIQLEKDFQSSLIDSVSIGFVLSIIFILISTIIYSRIITSPIEHIFKGIKMLRKNVNTKLKNTGSPEFDLIIEEFNKFVNKLSYQEELRENLIADISHELKTPITAMMGQLQGVEDKVFELDDKRIQLMKLQLQRLDQLVDTLKEYTSIKSKLTKIDKHTEVLVDVINQVVESYKTKLDTKKISVEVNIPKTYRISCNRILLERVFNNLIENTIKYSQAKLIRISSDKDTIIFSDNGVGIGKEHLGKIFERFYRVEGSRNRELGGLGLGLALVKEIVEAHGWQIEVKSGGEIKGTQFIINL